MEKNSSKKTILRFICIILGSMIMAANIKIFVRAGNLFPGGFAGLTVLIQRSFSEFANLEIPYSVLYYSLNLFPAIIGFKMVGKKFTLYSCAVIALSGALVDVIPQQTVTFDPLLIAIFGGILNGTSISIALKGDASTGGTDFLAMFIAKRFDTSSWNYILGFNVIMLVVAGALFGWDAALYSIIFQFVSTQVVNSLHVKYKKVTLNIVTTKADELQEQLLTYTHHGITRFEGEGCYSKEHVSMLYTVVSTDQLKSVMKLIHDLDEHAFVNVVKTQTLEGRFWQQPIE